jgi:hypothetical protein
MTDKAPPAGWVIQLTIPGLPSAEGVKWLGSAVLAAPSFKYFNVAMADRGKATEAATTYLAKIEGMDGETHAVRALSSAEMDTLGLNAGEVKPA